MTNEMKLLRAFIEASGYEVERITSTSLDGVQFSDDNPYHLIDANRINDVVIDAEYKVTKKRKCDRCAGRGVIEGGKVATDCPDCGRELITSKEAGKL